MEAMEEADRRYLRRVPAEPDRVRALGFTALALGAAAFAGWRAGLAADPDVGRDARMMVPVFYDLDRRAT